MGAGAYSVYTNFKAKDGVTPVFKNMTQGATALDSKIGYLNKRSAGFGTTLGGLTDKVKTLAGAFVAYFAVDKVKGFFDKAINAASDLQETMGKTGEVFKENFAAVEKWSQGSIKTMGLAQQTALDTASLFGDMGTGMGMTTKRAAEMSMSLTQLSADMASFKNVEQGLAANALKGIFTGETEALKNMGVVMTETVLQEYARANGIRKKMKDMTQAEKIELRYQFVMKATKNAQGDFLRTFGNYANQKRVSEELKKQAEINVGKILLPSWNRFMVAYNSFFTNNIDKVTNGIEKAFNWISLLVKQAKPAIDEVGKTWKYFVDEIMPDLVALAPLVQGTFAGVIIPALIMTTKAVNGLLHAVNFAFDFINGVFGFIKENWLSILLALPFAIVGVQIAVDVLRLKFALLKMESTLVAAVFNGNLLKSLGLLTAGVWKSVTALLAQAAAWAATPFGMITLAIMAVVGAAIFLWKNWDKITETIGNWWNKTVSWLSSFVPLIRTVFSNIGEFIKKNFVDILLNSLGVIGLMIRGVMKLSGAVMDLNNNGKNAKANADIYNSAAENAGMNGKIDVGVKLENNTDTKATTTTKLKGDNNLNLNQT